MTDTKTHSLDGTSMQYTYSEMGTVRTAYEDGRVSFEWLAGPIAGEIGKGFPYSARKVGDDSYFVSWHEPEQFGFVTLHIDFNTGHVHSSVLAGYGTPDEGIHFDIATIEKVTRIEKSTS